MERGGVKGQKMTQYGKKLCLSQFVSQEPFLIWLWFLVHVQNNDISILFKKIWFVRFLGEGGGSGWVKAQKMTQNYQFQSIMYYILETVDHFWYAGVR